MAGRPRKKFLSIEEAFAHREKVLEAARRRAKKHYADPKKKKKKLRKRMERALKKSIPLQTAERSARASTETSTLCFKKSSSSTSMYALRSSTKLKQTQE